MNKDQLKEEKEMEIDLLSLFFYLIQKWKILLLGAIIGGILAEGMTLLKTPMYQSTSTLYMLSKTTSITSMADLQLGSELSSDFTIIASSKPVVDAAVESLKEDKKYHPYPWTDPEHAQCGKQRRHTNALNHSYK